MAALPLDGALLLAVVADDRGRTYTVPLVNDGSDVRRAVPADGAAEALVGLLDRGDVERDGFRVTSWHHRPLSGERAITVDQTNESVVVGGAGAGADSGTGGDGAVVKWSFVADEGPHPAPSLMAALTQAGFTGTPRPWGVVEWDGRLLASVVDHVPGAVDGWTWAVDDLASLDPDRAEAAFTAVGRLVADLHDALAVTARTADAGEVARWRSEARADLALALEVSRSAVLRECAEEVATALEVVPDGSVQVQRVHGDLHVGQVLRDGHGRHLVTDFDGNPVVPPPLRLREQPVAVDVAGLAQSITHAGVVVRRHHSELDARLVRQTAAAARSAFLSAYGEVDPRLLRALSLRQVCREFTYAATHLPRWSYVPEAALPLLLEEDHW